jgi:hypothetical protein
VCTCTQGFFFLGRDFRNLGGTRKFRYPPKNCSTGQKNSVNLNLNSDPESNIERMRVPFYRTLWRGGSAANKYDSAGGRVFKT